MRNLYALIGLLVATSSHASGPIRVAVIDTGLAASAKVKLCKSGHKDIVSSNKISQLNPHGTNVSGLIEQWANNANYCQIIIRWYDANLSMEQLAHNMALSIKAAIDAKADIINISAAGANPYELERKFIKKALDKGIKVVVSAGNNGSNLDVNCNSYPACYDKRIIVIGNVNKDGSRHWLTNYGKIVDHYVIGVDRCAEGVCMTGTSQSAAIVTGRTVHDMYVLKNKQKHSIAGR